MASESFAYEKSYLSRYSVAVDGYGPLHVYGHDEVTFSPYDSWSQTGREGLWEALQKHENPHTVVEYGVGTGAGLILAGQNPRVQRLIGCDIRQEIVDVARFNVLANASLFTGKQIEMRLIGKIGDFTEQLQAEGVSADIIYFCLPQVILEAGNILTTRAASDYYELDDYPSYQEWGLGLIYAALDSSRDILAPNGKVVPVLSGRLPTHIKDSLIMDTGYHGGVIHKTIVTQDPNTSLESFLGNSDIELFEDCGGQYQKITIDEAVRRQKAVGFGNPANIHHTVGVYELALL